MENCFEKILEDIVQIDFYDGATCSYSFPFNAGATDAMNVIQTIAGVQYDIAVTTGEPVLTLSVGADGNAADDIDPPTHKITEKREPSGLIRTHTLTAPVQAGFSDIQRADSVLNGKEVLAVLTAYNGTKYCVHYLPNTPLFSYEDSLGQGHTGTVKYTAQSMSDLVVVSAT